MSLKHEPASADTIATRPNLMCEVPLDRLKAHIDKYSLFFCNLAIQDPALIHFSSSVAAAAAVACARDVAGVADVWPAPLAGVIRADKKEVAECYTQMCGTFRRGFPDQPEGKREGFGRALSPTPPVSQTQGYLAHKKEAEVEPLLDTPAAASTSLAHDSLADTSVDSECAGVSSARSAGGEEGVAGSVAPVALGADAHAEAAAAEHSRPQKRMRTATRPSDVPSQGLAPPSDVSSPSAIETRAGTSPASCGYLGAGAQTSIKSVVTSRASLKALSGVGSPANVVLAMERWAVPDCV